jgi:hypothetical protein
VALRLRLSPDLPLSQHLSSPERRFCQFGKIQNDVRFGSLAVIETNSSVMAALGWMAAIRPG